MEKRKDNTMLTTDERIDKFLQGKMDQEEADQFRSDLQSDSELRLRATILASAAKSLRRVGKSQDKNLVNTIEQEQEAIAALNVEPKVAAASLDTTTPGNRWWSLISGIAACAVIGLFVADYHMTKVDTLDLAQQSMGMVSYFDDESIYRGASKEDLLLFSEIEDIVTDLDHKENLKSNIRKLSELFELSLSDTYNQYTNYYREIGYYLSVAYLKDNDRKHASLVLRRLLELDPDYKDAKNLLEKIDDIKGLF